MALNDDVDRAPGDTEHAGVERHLDRCPECRALADDLRDIRRATKALTPVEPPAAIWRRIEHAIRQEAPAESASTAPGVSLINEMRKGNDAGAARIVSGLKQKG